MVRKKLLWMYSFLAITVLGFSLSIGTQEAEAPMAIQQSQKIVVGPGSFGTEGELAVIDQGQAEAVTPIVEEKANQETFDLNSFKAQMRELRKGKSLKDRIVLKVVEKKIEKQLKNDSPDRSTGTKSQLVALLLCIFLGYLGIHRFYLGYTGVGILMLLTGGVCGILTLIDLIRIITGDLKPKGGEYDETF